MTAGADRRTSLAWQRGDCAGLLSLAIVWGLAVASGLGGRTAAGERLGVDPERVQSVREGIDPNTASLASLMRLPDIKRVRAEAIVQYRTAAASRPAAGNGRAFEFVEDLELVKGIGPGIVSHLAGAVALPSRASATAPGGDAR